MTRRVGLAAIAVAILALPSGAQESVVADGGAGAEAFARRDFATAAELWREEAAAGSARAKLGLGLIADLGLGAPRDAAEALRWYLEAAEAGLTDAQFNVGVMLDAGTGVPHDPVAASVWYARAAASGHRRAQYNLGLLYESGDGVPRNADLARHWLVQAASELEAAQERLAGLDPVPAEDRALDAPTVLSGAVVAGEGARRAELVWSAQPGPADAPFLVELARVPEAGETWGDLVTARRTEASALAAPLPSESADYAWRVSRVDEPAAGYAASRWRRLAAAPEGASGLPEGRVTLRVAAGDAPARRLAREVRDTLASAGLWTRVQEATTVPAETTVLYAYDQDADLASSVAAFLPVLDEGDAVRRPGLGALPGEVVVALVGGPASDDADPADGPRPDEATPLPAAQRSSVSQTSIVPGSGRGR